MNLRRQHRSIRGAAVIIGAMFTSLLFASSLGAAELKPEIRSGNNREAIRPEVESFVKAQVDSLTGADPAARGTARAALIDELAPVAPGQPKPSVTFVSVYAESVATAIKPLLNDKDPRVRLNVAIVVARLADRSDQSAWAFTDSVADLLKDESDGVIVWAIRGAGPLVGRVPSTPGVAPGVASKLLAEMVDAVKARLESVPVVQSVYETLADDTNRPRMAQVGGPIIDAMLKTFSMRLNQYKSGKAASPALERTPAFFLTAREVWAVETPQQQFQTVQLLSNAIGLSAQLYGPASGPSRTELIELIKNAAGGIQVVGDRIGQNFTSVTNPLSSLTQTAQPADIINRADELQKALVKCPAFAAVKPAPTVSSGSGAATTTTTTGDGAAPTANNTAGQ